jgi:enoyl-CoA hydratase
MAPRALVRVEIEANVATLTLDDPDRRNTISHALNAELIAALDTIETDETARAIVVTGAGSAFCAGGDLEELRSCSSGEELRQIYAGFLRLAKCRVPTIAAVNGAAVGAGMNMALACDVILAGRRARFDSRFLQIGIHPGGGHTWRLRRITDQQTVMAMVLFGEVLDGARAAEVGVAWRCVDDADLAAVAMQMAVRATLAPRELAARTKATVLELARIDSADDAVTHELHPQRWSMGQPAFDELITSLQRQITGSRSTTTSGD